MCFCFGIKILKLVYNKAFFEILNGFYLIWPFILRKKYCSFAPYKSWKKISSKLAVTGYQKKRNFTLISKMCRSLGFGQREKNFLQKNWIFRDFSKKLFFWEKLFRNFLMQEFYTFLKSAQNSASFDILCAQFWRYFSNSYKGQCCFLEVKTVQYFKKLFFIN